MTALSGTVKGETWSPEEERARLDEVAEWYDSRRGLNREIVKRAAKRVLAGAGGRRALELGCANGVMTEELSRRFPHLDVVDGAERYVREARAIVSGRPSEECRQQVHHCLFENFEPHARYDVIVMAYVLEHVADPKGLMKRARGWLVSGGEIHLVVPNAASLHRRVGLSMGLLHHLRELNETDLAVGHRRVYTWERLAQDIEAAGLRLVSMDGILLKPLPSVLMEVWPQDLRNAFFELAPLAPRLCSEIHAVCCHPNHGNATHSADRVR
ncbi:MAG: class I SAM-dependent methyltransferase [Armatimonadota bacterium]|nr:MAG: class I SAM-dependent methyltransferase [Armatimonadota bacterium]